MVDSHAASFPPECKLIGSQVPRQICNLQIALRPRLREDGNMATFILFPMSKRSCLLVTGQGGGECNLRSRDLGYIMNVPSIYFASSYERKINIGIHMYVRTTCT